LGLAIVGAAVFAFQRGHWSDRVTWQLAGGGLIVMGGWLAMAPTSPASSLDPVRRELAVVIPRPIRIRSEERSPQQLSVIAIGTSAHVTFAEGCILTDHVVELLVSCWGGSVDVQLPDSWPVVAGRVNAARMIRLDGKLDRNDAFADPRTPADYGTLQKLIKKRRENHPPRDPSRPSAALVMHVTGIGGQISISRESTLRDH
jgi:hypothetical protein